METKNVFRLKHGTVEVEVAGESSFISETLGMLTDVLRAFREYQGRVEEPIEAPVTLVESGSTNANVSAGGPATIPVAKLDGKPPTLIEFLNEKGPKSFYEQAVCVAYYMEKFSGVDSFTSKELADCWKSSKLVVPGNTAQVVTTACQKSYLNQVDATTPFRYQLTVTGEKLVENMVNSSADAPTRRKSSGKARRPTPVDGPLKLILETPKDQINLDKYPDIHHARSVVQEVCWVLLVYRNELKVESLGPTEVSQILSQKFGIKRSVETVASALSRNKKAVDRVGRGDYRLMRVGEDIAMGRFDDGQA